MEKILCAALICSTAGKYLNIIRQCGREVKRPLPLDVHIGAALVSISGGLISCNSYAAWRLKPLKLIVSLQQAAEL